MIETNSNVCIINKYTHVIDNVDTIIRTSILWLYIAILAREVTHTYWVIKISIVNKYIS